MRFETEQLIHRIEARIQDGLKDNKPVKRVYLTPSEKIQLRNELRSTAGVYIPENIAGFTYRGVTILDEMMPFGGTEADMKTCMDMAGRLP